MRRHGSPNSQESSSRLSSARTPLLLSSTDPTATPVLDNTASDDLRDTLPLVPSHHDNEDNVTQESPRCGEQSLSSIKLVLGCGIVMGLVMPKNPRLHTPWIRTLSSCLGYTYFVAWSTSFYPQCLTNRARQSTHGVSVDFCLLNVLGFACYSIYTVSLYAIPQVRREYHERYGAHANITVQSNDVAFAVHALILSSITYLQIVYYGHNGTNGNSTTTTTRFAGRPSNLVSGFVLLILLFMVGYPFVLHCLPSVVPSSYHALDYIYTLSYIKVMITTIKYIPQVRLNWQRQSTVGWNIQPMILDFTGGLLSNVQLVVDALDDHNWSGITGNLPKLGLGSISMVFDIIFVLQHYVWYPEKATPCDELIVEESSYQALLGGEDEEESTPNA
jgi:cystinosin